MVEKNVRAFYPLLALGISIYGIRQYVQQEWDSDDSTSPRFQCVSTPILAILILISKRAPGSIHILREIAHAYYLYTVDAAPGNIHEYTAS